MIPLGAQVTDRTSVTHDELHEIPLAERAYALPEETDAEQAWRKKRDEIERQYTIELEAEWPAMRDVIREHGAFKAYDISLKRGPSKADVGRSRALVVIGPSPITPQDRRTYTVGVYGPATGLTESARAVVAWKAAMGQGQR